MKHNFHISNNFLGFFFLFTITTILFISCASSEVSKSYDERLSEAETYYSNEQYYNAYQSYRELRSEYSITPITDYRIAYSYSNVYQSEVTLNGTTDLENLQQFFNAHKKLIESDNTSYINESLRFLDIKSLSSLGLLSYDSHKLDKAQKYLEEYQNRIDSKIHEDFNIESVGYNQRADVIRFYSSFSKLTSIEDYGNVLYSLGMLQYEISDGKINNEIEEILSIAFTILNDQRKKTNIQDIFHLNSITSIDPESRKYKVIADQMISLRDENRIIEAVDLYENEILKEIKNVDQDNLEYLKTKALYEETRQLLSPIEKLNDNFDDFTNIHWYKQKLFYHSDRDNLMSMYIGVKDSDQWLRLKISYYGKDWIFFEKIYLSNDGEIVEIPFNKPLDKKTDNDAGKVWEWIDILLDEDLYSFLKLYANSENPKIRLSGKYTQTRDLSTAEIKGLQEIIDAYDSLIETP